MAVQSAKELTVYKKGYAVAMRVSNLANVFPLRNAMHSPVSCAIHPVRSAIICARRGRNAVTHRTSSASSVIATVTPPSTLLETADTSATPSHLELAAQIAEIGKMLGSMINNPDPFLLPPNTNHRNDS